MSLITCMSSTNHVGNWQDYCVSKTKRTLFKRAEMDKTRYQHNWNRQNYSWYISWVKGNFLKNAYWLKWNCSENILKFSADIIERLENRYLIRWKNLCLNSWTILCIWIFIFSSYLHKIYENSKTSHTYLKYCIVN